MLAAETETEESYEAARLARRKVTKSDHSVSSFLFPPCCVACAAEADYLRVHLLALLCVQCAGSGAGRTHESYPNEWEECASV